MNHRNGPAWPWLAVAGGLALGAALAWAVDQSIRRMQRVPGPVSDDIVLANVRSRVSELVSRPDSVEVSVENGVVRLAGSVTAEERDALLTQLVYMPGVVRLRNALASS